MKKEKLQGHKTVKVFGARYVIRKINPLLDFSYDTMPQIFSSHISKRPVVDTTPHIAQLQKALKEMKLIVQTALVDPVLIPVGKGEKYRKEDGITVDDMFVDAELGSRLYLEIIAHSLNRFKGIKGFFFTMRIRHSLLTEWRKSMDKDPLTFYSQTAITP